MFDQTGFIAAVTAERLREVDIRACGALNFPLLVRFHRIRASASIPAPLKMALPSDVSANFLVDAVVQVPQDLR